MGDHINGVMVNLLSSPLIMISVVMQKSVILNRLFITINPLEYISDLDILKFGYNEKISCPHKISL